MIERAQPTIFSTYTNIHVAVSSIADGQTNYDHGDKKQVAHNITQILKKTNNPATQIAHIACTYGDRKYNDIVNINRSADTLPSRPMEDYRYKNDAIITTKPMQALLLPVADCIAAVLFDPKNVVLVVAHLGRQAINDKLPKTLAVHLAEQYGSDPADILVYCSPSIHHEDYIFDTHPYPNDLGWAPYVTEKNDGLHINIRGYARQQLLESGVTANHLEMSDINTAQSDDYESHSIRAKNHLSPAKRFLVTATLLSTVQPL